MVLAPPPDSPPIRDAATVIVLRDAATEPRILVGQRGAGAAFMPNKFVFPGGALDAGDAAVPLASALPDPDHGRVADGSPNRPATAFAAAAIRELWEETGLLLGQPGHWADPPPDWQSFAGTGHRPAAASLRFVFRAVTPPGRPRRFDARFFLTDAAALMGDPDDFSRASDELSHLQWVTLAEIRRMDLPFITGIVLAEVAARLPELGPPPSVPFFANDDEGTRFVETGGRINWP